MKAPSGASYQINGYINSDNLVERVETWLGENLMGDMHIVAKYSDYRAFGGAVVPTKIVQTRGGWPFFEVDVTNATGNPPNLAALAPQPAPPAGGASGRRWSARRSTAGAHAHEGGARARGSGATRRVAGSYDSIIAEFDDYIMMLEAGQNQARAQLYIDEIKRQFPGKPIRYVWNSHPHGDHTPGIPAVVAEGATVIAQANAVEFFDRALNTPRTLLDDTLAKNPRRVRVDSVEDKRVYTDGERTVEFYHIYPGAALERLDDRVLPAGEDPVPGRLLGESGPGRQRHAARERSRARARAGAREARYRLRALHQRPCFRGSADEGGRHGGDERGDERPIASACIGDGTSSPSLLTELGGRMAAELFCGVECPARATSRGPCNPARSSESR